MQKSELWISLEFFCGVKNRSKSWPGCAKKEKSSSFFNSGTKYKACAFAVLSQRNSEGYTARDHARTKAEALWIKLHADNNPCDAILLLTEENRNNFSLLGQYFQWLYDTGLFFPETLCSSICSAYSRSLLEIFFFAFPNFITNFWTNFPFLFLL